MEIVRFDTRYTHDLKVLGQGLRNYIISLENRDDDMIIYNTDKEMEEYIEDFSRAENIIFLAKDEEKIQGYVIAKIKNDNWEGSQIKSVGRIEQLFINPDFRGKGAGKKLLEKCESFFLKQCISHMEVSVFARNKNAFDFYKKYGFDERLITLDKKITPEQEGK